MRVNFCNNYLDKSGESKKTYAELALLKAVSSMLPTSNMFVFDLDTWYW